MCYVVYVFNMSSLYKNVSSVRKETFCILFQLLIDLKFLEYCLVHNKFQLSICWLKWVWNQTFKRLRSISEFISSNFHVLKNEETEDQRYKVRVHPVIRGTYLIPESHFQPLLSLIQATLNCSWFCQYVL